MIEVKINELSIYSFISQPTNSHKAQHTSHKAQKTVRLSYSAIIQKKWDVGITLKSENELRVPYKTLKPSASSEARQAPMFVYLLMMKIHLLRAK